MLRNVHIWIIPYLIQRFHSLFRPGISSDTHVLFCIADHFEPLWGGAGIDVGEERIKKWVEDYEGVASSFVDSDGYHPRHSYFFPLEQYNERFGSILRAHCNRGFGEVEFHLHHNNDSTENFRKTIEQYKKIFSNDGFLGTDQNGIIRYGFVHGNWALDNSDPDGAWCGLNNELTILNETGCYGDFTLPSAPSPTQTSTINSIYYAIDDPEKPKSHNRGIGVRVGGEPPSEGEHLMIIQGVLGLDWGWRRYVIIPRLENSDISAGHPFMPHRWKLWTDALVSVRGRPEWTFIKVHMHGCHDSTREMLFSKGALHSLYESAQNLRTDGKIAGFHYVSAREMYNIIKAAEAGLEGNPNEYRDFVILPPPL